MYTIQLQPTLTFIIKYHVVFHPFPKKKKNRFWIPGITSLLQQKRVYYTCIACVLLLKYRIGHTEIV